MEYSRTLGLVLTAAFIVPIAAIGAQPGLPSQSSDMTTTRSNPDDDTTTDGEQKKKREESENERGPLERGVDITTPQVVNEAPLPPQGVPAPTPEVVRGPLYIERSDFSAGFDHLISREFALTGLIGYSYGKVHRAQTSFFGPPPGQEDDTTIQTENQNGALILSYFPTRNAFADFALSYGRTSYRIQRIVNEIAPFSGKTAGESFGASLDAGLVFRFAQCAVIPQIGVDYVDSRVSATRLNLPVQGDPVGLNIFMSGQRVKTTDAHYDLQLQWINSVGFGTLTPYARVRYRQRLDTRANQVIATADGPQDIVIDLTTLSSKYATTVGGGLLAQFRHGIGAFLDFSRTEGTADLRERRIAVGLRFEF